MNDSISIFDSPVGPLLARASEGKLVELSFNHRAKIGYRTATDANAGGDAVLQTTQAQIMEYFAHERTVFELPLELRGPAFHRRVWEALYAIPYGKTASYGELDGSAWRSGCGTRGRRGQRGQSDCNYHSVPQSDRSRRQPGWLRRRTSAQAHAARFGKPFNAARSAVSAT